MSTNVLVGHGQPEPEVQVVKRSLGLGSLVFIMFFTVSGGAYGLEDVIGESGAGAGILLILVTPIIWSLPAALMVAELATAMPVEGGYYYWVKKAMGPFWGFQEGWWSWLTTFVDMAIYPVLFVEYASYYFDVLDTNPVARWLVGFAVIWFFTLLNIRGAKVVGDYSILLGVMVLAPFVHLRRCPGARSRRLFVSNVFADAQYVTGDTAEINPYCRLL
jgi:amino acid transporter